jgi:hypothetical protein
MTNNEGAIVLRRDAKARFVCRETGFVFKKRFWRFCSGKQCMQGELDDSTYNSLLVHQQNEPALVMVDYASRRRWWMFRGDIFSEDEGFSDAEVKILILDRIQQKERKLQRARARLTRSAELSAARQSIPDDVKVFVWQRDNGCCVKCGGREKLEYDHIIPLCMGGGNSERNLQILCESCNRSKGGNLG